MGIQNRDRAEIGRQRFAANESDKEARLNLVRKRFERFSQKIAREGGRRNIGKAYRPNSFWPAMMFWIGLFMCAYGAFSWREAPTMVSTSTVTEVLIPRATDGHYYIDGSINGVPIRFLVDTGASYVAVGAPIAKRIGLNGDISAVFQTANGNVSGLLAKNQLVQLPGLSVPPLTVSIMPNAGETALLGQNFLSHITMTQAANQLSLRGKPGFGVNLPSFASGKKIFGLGVVLVLLSLAAYWLRGARQH